MHHAFLEDIDCGIRRRAIEATGEEEEEDLNSNLEANILSQGGR